VNVERWHATATAHVAQVRPAKIASAMRSTTAHSGVKDEDEAPNNSGGRV
jgi:hypothetical protein